MNLRPKRKANLWFLHDSNACYEIVVRDTQHLLVRCCLQRESSPKQEVQSAIKIFTFCIANLAKTGAIFKRKSQQLGNFINLGGI
jgi:hypothetical protein